MTDEAAGAASQYSSSTRRVTALLELFSAERPSVTLPEVVELLGWPKPTAHRYLAALRESRFLRYDERDATYHVGPKALALAAAAGAGLPLITLANPHMAALARATRVTTLLTVLGDEEPVVVSMHDSTGYLVSVHVPIGSRLPLNRSAHGEIYLALEPALEHRRREFAGDTVLQARLDSIRRLGVATNDDLVTGISGIAAPITVAGRLVGALGILGTAAMVPTDLNSFQVVQLRAVCAQIAAELGGTPPAPPPAGATDIKEKQ